MKEPDTKSVLERIQSYLGNGGLFNPEMMEHDKVRLLIMDCCDCLEALWQDKEMLDWLQRTYPFGMAQLLNSNRVGGLRLTILDAMQKEGK